MLRIGRAPAVPAPQDFAAGAKRGDEGPCDPIDDRFVAIRVEQAATIVEHVAKRATRDAV
jgi:hypothetical protein